MFSFYNGSIYYNARKNDSVKMTSNSVQRHMNLKKVCGMGVPRGGLMSWAYPGEG